MLPKTESFGAARMSRRRGAMNLAAVYVIYNTIAPFQCQACKKGQNTRRRPTKNAENNAPRCAVREPSFRPSPAVASRFSSAICQCKDNLPFLNFTSKDVESEAAKSALQTADVNISYFFQASLKPRFCVKCLKRFSAFA